MRHTTKYEIRGRAYFSHRTLVLVPFGILTNVLLSRLAALLRLPLRLDTLGTLLCASLIGAIPGMITAFITNLIGHIWNPSAIVFDMLIVLMAYLTAQFSRRGFLRNLRGLILQWLMMVTMVGAAGFLTGWLVSGKNAGGTTVSPYIMRLCGYGFSGFAAQFAGCIIRDMADKGITLAAAALVLRFLPQKMRRSLPLGYIYNCTDEQLASDLEKMRRPYKGRSVYIKVIRILTISLVSMGICVTAYSIIRYTVNVYSKNGNVYALFEYIVHLVDLEFLIIMFILSLTSWITYIGLKKPLDEIINHTAAFGKYVPDLWLDSEEWKNRLVIRTNDEIQVLYETICRSERSIAQKVISIREDEDKLRELSETDMMTGIRNRGSGEQKITELIESGAEGLFCLLDCDNFKMINDTYGHGTGDDVLVAIASKMKSVCRENDVFMRLGGDEFALYLPGITKNAQAENFFRRFFGGLAEISVPGLKDRKFYVSLGASFNSGCGSCTFDSLYKNADKALYLSKKLDGFCANIYGTDGQPYIF